MAITLNYQICNMAFSMMGSQYGVDQEMTAADFLTPTQSHHKQAVLFYDTVLETILSEHNWSFARRRIQLDTDNFEITVTSGTNANPCVLTAATHGVKEGCGITLYGFGIDELDDQIFIAKTVATSTLQLYWPDNITTFNSTSIGTIGAGKMRLHPLTMYNYKFRLPSDFIRFWKVTAYNSRWQIEKDGSYAYLLTDDSDPQVEYLMSVTDVSRFTKQFIIYFARVLAKEIAGPLADKPQTKVLLDRELLDDKRAALMVNARQDFNKDNDDKVDIHRESPWVRAGR